RVARANGTLAADGRAALHPPRRVGLPRDVAAVVRIRRCCMTAPLPSLRRAIELHRAGALAEAAATYRDVLAREPNCIEALHHLGLIAFQRGQPAEAAGLLQRAADLAPGDSTILGNLGAALRSLERIDDAILCYQQALAVR